LPWGRGFEYYRRRKEEVRKPLLDDYFFKKFIGFVEWRKSRTLRG